MKRRRWKPEQKALIVLAGLKGRPIGELCAEHEISQGQYYQWRDQLLANAAKAFEPAGAPQRQGRLERENARLKSLVGELALELKKRGDPRMRRGPYAKVAARNAELLERIRDLKAEHPVATRSRLPMSSSFRGFTQALIFRPSRSDSSWMDPNAVCTSTSTTLQSPFCQPVRAHCLHRPRQFWDRQPRKMR